MVKPILTFKPFGAMAGVERAALRLAGRIARVLDIDMPKAAAANAEEDANQKLTEARQLVIRSLEKRYTDNGTRVSYLQTSAVQQHLDRVERLPAGALYAYATLLSRIDEEPNADIWFGVIRSGKLTEKEKRIKAEQGY